MVRSGDLVEPPFCLAAVGERRTGERLAASRGREDVRSSPARRKWVTWRLVTDMSTARPLLRELAHAHVPVTAEQCQYGDGPAGDSPDGSRPSAISRLRRRRLLNWRISSSY